MGIGKLDTVKDKEGKRFRVADVHTVDGQIIAVLKGIHPDGSPRRGGARNVRVDVLEKEYTRVDLPPVTIKKIDDLSEEEKPMVKEPTPSQKAAQIEAQAVRELSKKDIEKAVNKSTFGGKQEQNGDIEILKAEILDLKKTISKMKQAHEEEVRDLKDQLMEAQAMSNAATKYKDEVVAERNQFSDALDDDSVTFEAILDLATAIRQSANAMHTMAARIEKETEGRI